MEPLREGFSLLDRSIPPPCGMTWSPQSFSIPPETPSCLQAWKERGRMGQRDDRENVTPNCWRAAKHRARVLSMHGKKIKIKFTVSRKTLWLFHPQGQRNLTPGMQPKVERSRNFNVCTRKEHFHSQSEHSPSNPAV